jgi:hypothetical protein
MPQRSQRVPSQVQLQHQAPTLPHLSNQSASQQQHAPQPP